MEKIYICKYNNILIDNNFYTLVSSCMGRLNILILVKIKQQNKHQVITQIKYISKEYVNTTLFYAKLP